MTYHPSGQILLQISVKIGNDKTSVLEPCKQTADLRYLYWKAAVCYCFSSNAGDVVVLHDIPVHAKKDKKCCGK